MNNGFIDLERDAKPYLIPRLKVKSRRKKGLVFYVEKFFILFYRGMKEVYYMFSGGF